MRIKRGLAAAAAALVLTLPELALATPLAPSLSPMAPAVTVPAMPPRGGTVTPALPGSGDKLPAKGPADEEGLVSVSGVLTYVTDLETPHYEVGGWAIVMDAGALPKLVGQSVTVTGTPSDGFSIIMKHQLMVRELQVTLEGSVILVSDVETSHYELGGVVLKSADTAALERLNGKVAVVTGRLVTGPSVYMMPVIEVRDAWGVGTRLPSKVVVRGRAPALPTRMLMADGHLMLPLRATVEAAGGKVGWDARAMAVRIALEGRSALIKIGQTAYSNGELPVAPVLVDGYTLAPVELLADLGLVQRWDGSVLYLDLTGTTQPAVE